jgi:hypothetical protein
MDGVFMFSAEGPAVVLWTKEPRTGAGVRIEKWLTDAIEKIVAVRVSSWTRSRR